MTWDRLQFYRPVTRGWPRTRCRGGSGGPGRVRLLCIIKAIRPASFIYLYNPSGDSKAPRLSGERRARYSTGTSAALTRERRETGPKQAGERRARYRTGTSAALTRERRETGPNGPKASRRAAGSLQDWDFSSTDARTQGNGPKASRRAGGRTSAPQ